MFIRLIGVFEVRDSAGRDFTPRGAKARALLAMLCQTPDHRRARRWIEARLWSDRGTEQASGSLRQALMELRRALGPLAGRLQADRASVSLSDFVTDLSTESEAAAEALRNGREFLEDIDIVDPAFHAWLREERQRVAAQLGLGAAATAPDLAPAAESLHRPPYVLRLGSLPEGSATFIARDLAQAIARLTAEFLHVDIYDTSATGTAESLPRDGLDLHVEGAWIHGRANLMVSLIARDSQQTIWSQRLTAVRVEDVAEGQGDVPAVVFEAVEAALMQMSRLAETDRSPANQVNARIARAVAAMFSFDARRLEEADRLLQEAGEILPSDRIPAWRSLVRQIMFVERTGASPAVLRDQADALARRAMELSDGTPLVLALVSLTRVMVDENPEAGTVLADTAKRRSPFNPFSWWADCAAEIRHGRNDAALASARRGAEIVARSSLLHSWEALAGLAALHGNHLGAAIAHFESAHYRAPKYRAAMRHLAYLYLEAGLPDKAARVTRALVRAEPDFSADAVLDADYPAITLRRSGLADRHRAPMSALLATLREG